MDSLAEGSDSNSWSPLILDRPTVQDQTRRATRALVAAPSADRLDLVGVDLHPERKLIAKIIHSLRLLA
jgi:hypothetical protein